MPDKYPPLKLTDPWPFKKHKGTLFEKVLEGDLEYVKWAIRETDLQLENAAFEAFQRAVDAADSPGWER